MINIIGLFTGLTFSLLIAAYVWGELEVNRDLKNADHQYILMSDWKEPNMGLDFTTLAPLAKRLKENYPGLVENYLRWDGISSNVSIGDTNFREGIQLCDSTLLSIYGFKLLYGNKKTALTNPYSVIITEKKAIKYFGKSDVIDQTITIQNFSGDKHEFVITGVLNELSKNSVTKFNDNNQPDFFIPINTLSYFGRADFTSWSNIYVLSYIELKKGATAKDLEIPIKTLIEQNAPERIKQNLKVNPVLLTDYYLHKDNDLVNKMLTTLSFVGLFILLMAIVNFINITISSADSRLKEIGIRKVLGGLKVQLIFQFLIESFIMVLLASIFAIITFSFLRPLFSDIVGSPIPELFSFPFYFVYLFFALIVLLSLLAGLFPAFILSSLKPTDSLKGRMKTIKGSVYLRKLLVGFQFSVALIVLISALVVTQQIVFFFGQNLGYNKEYVLSSQVPRDWTIKGIQKMKTIRNEFEAMPQISAASLSYEIPNGNYGNQLPIYQIGTDPAQAISMLTLAIDDKFLSTYEIPLKAESTFIKTHKIDSSKVVINEKAVQALGWKSSNEAIGQKLKIANSDIVYTIQGVSNDFHFGSMHQQIKPIIFFNLRVFKAYRYLSFRIKPNNMAAMIGEIQKKWRDLLPGSSFEYSFMDETLMKLYSSEIQLKKAAYFASVLALIIVLLGIIGLVSLSIHKRNKEIGIRKILGASSPVIIKLFLNEFFTIILLACVMAIPLSYFIMESWLNNYVYRINISAKPFIFSIGALIIITILLIGGLTWKAASANPVASLRRSE
jgi:ABC-type antimicrobial peptide transport system permease subunit